MSPLENIGGEPRRGNSKAPMEKAIEHKEMMLERLSKEYKELQMHIIRLEDDLHRGVEHAIQEQNSQVRDLSTEVGRKITQEIVLLNDQKAELEERIRNVGGNPSDYTVN